MIQYDGGTKSVIQIEGSGVVRKGALAVRKRASQSLRIQILSHTLAPDNSLETLPLIDPSAVRCVTTTQTPRLGQVTHEHAMRSAILQLYCAIHERACPHIPWTEFVGLRNFRLCVHFGWGPAGRLRGVRQPRCKARRCSRLRSLALKRM